MIVGLMVCLGACTDEPGPSGDPNTTGSPAPRRGGEVVFGVLGEPPTLDPYSPRATDLTWAVVRPVYPSLFRFLPDGTTEPYLAERIETVGRRALVVLRRWRWSNDRRVTARDVAASVRRALPPSGFARLRARELSQDTVEFRGRVSDWERTLATLGFVLPGGRADRVPRVSAGPLDVTRYTSGLEIVFRPNPAWGGPRPYLDRMTLQFVEFSDVLLALLERGRLDAALVPSTVNLADRLESRELEIDSALGWESVYLDLRGADLDRPGRAAIGRALDRTVIEQGFVRDDGRVADTLNPGPGEAGADGPWPVRLGGAASPVAPIQLSAPIGDELLELSERAIQAQLQDEGFTVELVNAAAAIFYGEWADSHPTDVALTRSAGSPGVSRDGLIRGLRAIPLYQVETTLAFAPGVHGMEVNPTFEGPLWNVETWWTEEAG